MIKGGKFGKINEQRARNKDWIKQLPSKSKV